MEYYDKTLKINPENPNALNNKGNCLKKMGRQESALECFNKALKINPKDELIWYN